MGLIKYKKKISKTVYLIIFAILMSSVTSSCVSGLTLFFARVKSKDFFELWVSSFLRSWPIVFFLILIFVPLINKFLSIFFIKNEDKR